MFLRIDPHSGVPVYKQIIEQISLHIHSGLLSPGQALPSVRELAANLEVNPMTVSKAYGFLEHDGLVRRRPGRPLVVNELSAEQVSTQGRKHLKKQLKPVVTTAQQLGMSLTELQDILKEAYEDDDD